MLMKVRQWMATFGLLGLVLAAGVGLVLTRQSTQLNSTASKGRRPPIVDEQPLKTARAMAALGSDEDEQRLFAAGTQTGGPPQRTVRNANTVVSGTGGVAAQQAWGSGNRSSGALKAVASRARSQTLQNDRFFP
jgi:hypothetical protein